ncbi:MAG: V-type ATP synthase subunit E [Lachnospiraceae bacterium]
MIIEEKLKHLQDAAMTEAREEGNKIIGTHRQALESIYQKHVEENRTQSTTRIKSEIIRAKQQLNQATAKAQVELKRKLGKRQLLLKDQLFSKVRNLLDDYMLTDAYIDLLQSYINDAASFAAGESLTIYMNANDVGKKAELEQRTGLSLTISKDDFYGGIRAAIPGRNILIDHSFKRKFESEYDKFQFGGGGTIG